MKLSNFFCTAMLVGTLAMFGCGDDGGGSSGGGNTNGGGGVCNTGSCVDNATLRQACEAGVAACELTLEGEPLQTCINGAIADACTE
jgi:hypothetical protein